MACKLKVGEFDCYAAALPAEELFVLLARDPVAPEVVRYWCKLRVERGHNHAGDPQIIEATQCANMMELERREIRRALGKLDV